MKSETVLQSPTGLEIPETWKWQTIDQIKNGIKGSLVSGPFGSNIGSKFFQISGTPVIRGNNLAFGEKFVDRDFAYVNEDRKSTRLNSSHT